MAGTFRCAILAASFAATLPSMAAAQERPTTTFTISEYRWYQLQRGTTSSGAPVFQAFANVRRLADNRIRYYALMFSPELTRVLALEVEVDCGTNTMRLIAGGGASGGIGALYARDEQHAPTAEGTTGRLIVRTVCDRRDWPVLDDPVSAGRAWIAQRD